METKKRVSGVGERLFNVLSVILFIFIIAGIVECISNGENARAIAVYLCFPALLYPALLIMEYASKKCLGAEGESDFWVRPRLKLKTFLKFILAFYFASIFPRIRTWIYS